MLALPLPATDVVLLADWLELAALLSGDGDASTGDLERALMSGGVLQVGGLDGLDDAAGPEAMGEKCLQVFRELEVRVAAADTAYPFDLADNGVLRVRTLATEFSAYTFCLCLSYSRFSHVTGATRFPRRHFEDLACIAAQNYLSGEVACFAAPRRVLPRAFYPAIDALCTQMAEGGPHRKSDRRTGQDRKLDLVAWRPFPDNQPGKVMLFGQCASGHDWEDKLGELNPDAFCKSYLLVQPISPMVRAFFIPHRIDRQSWEEVSRNAGIVFDRCRIAYWVHRSPAPPDAAKYIASATRLLDTLKQ